jgi:hypothetical protein
MRYWWEEFREYWRWYFGIKNDAEREAHNSGIERRAMAMVLLEREAMKAQDEHQVALMKRAIKEALDEQDAVPQYNGPGS